MFVSVVLLCLLKTDHFTIPCYYLPPETQVWVKLFSLVWANLSRSCNDMYVLVDQIIQMSKQLLNMYSRTDNLQILFLPYHYKTFSASLAFVFAIPQWQLVRVGVGMGVGGGGGIVAAIKLTCRLLSQNETE